MSVLRLPAYVQELARDGQLVGRDAQVWMVIAPRLDFVEFREITLADIASEFSPPISPMSVHRALRRLIERGFIEVHDDRSARGRKRYRVPLRRVYPREHAS